MNTLHVSVLSILFFYVSAFLFMCILFAIIFFCLNEVYFQFILLATVCLHSWSLAFAFVFLLANNSTTTTYNDLSSKMAKWKRRSRKRNDMYPKKHERRRIIGTIIKEVYVDVRHTDRHREGKGGGRGRGRKEGDIRKLNDTKSTIDRKITRQILYVFLLFLCIYTYLQFWLHFISFAVIFLDYTQTESILISVQRFLFVCIAIVISVTNIENNISIDFSFNKQTFLLLSLSCY